MVERPGRWANTKYIVDFIPLCLRPDKLKLEIFRDLYLKQGLSANQIATKIGCSRGLVLSRLHRADVPTEEKRLNNPKNYRSHEPPFGFAVNEGRLVPNKREMKIIRLIVHLRLNQNISFENIARELVQRKIKNRRGNIAWQYSVIRKFFYRWRDKI